MISSDKQLLKFKHGKLQLAGKRTVDSDYMGKITCKNVEQQMALELLLDNDVKAVVLKGGAGTGKTFLAAQAAIYLHEKKQYEHIFFTRNHIEIGRSIGYLPGDAFSKLMPYLSSFVDQLSSWHVMYDLLDRKVIEVQPLGFLQGRSFQNTFILIDEAQNIDKKIAKMLMTRVGENSKIVLMGDNQQVAHEDFENGKNGIDFIVEKFLEAKTDLFGIVELQESVRSPLAKLAAEIL